MSDELREILKRYFYPYNRQDAVLLNQTIKQIRSLQVQERKKWALGLVGEELKEGTLKYRSVTKHEMRGYNQAKAEILKKIEE